MLIADPTKSNWRDILLPNKNGSSTNKKTYRLDLYDLTPGQSQLANHYIEHGLIMNIVQKLFYLL